MGLYGAREQRPWTIGLQGRWHCRLDGAHRMPKDTNRNTTKDAINVQTGISCINLKVNIKRRLPGAAFQSVPNLVLKRPSATLRYL